MSCKSSNFDENVHLESLLFVLDLESSNIDELSKNIISVLKSRSFSTDIKTSDNPDTYNDSISNLIDNVVKKLSEKNKLKFDFAGVNITSLRRALKQNLLPAKKTKVDLNVLAVIPHVGLLSLEEIDLLRYKDVMSKIYGDNYIIRSYRDDLFKHKMISLLIIDVNTGSIVDDSSIINENLLKYKSDQYDILKNFIKSIEVDGKEFDSELIARSYYFSGDKSSKVDNIYSLMYNYLTYLKNKGLLDDMIVSAWKDRKKFGKSSFFDALNAYITLQFFDESLQNAFGKYIKINKDYDEPITEEDNKKIYKYSLSKGNTEMSHGWNTSDELDAIKQMAKVSTILITTIPMISHKNGSPIKIGRFLNLSPVLYVNSVINLRLAIENLSENYDLKELLNSTINDPEVKWREILKTIFLKDKVNILLKQTVGNKKILTDLDINILYSIYNQVFDMNNSHSYSSIEAKDMKLKGIQDRYSIVGILSGMIESVAGMNYIEMVYDKNSEIPGYKLRIKRKTYSNTSIYDIIRAINRRTYNRTDKRDLLEKYSIQSSNLEDKVTLTFNNVSIELKFGSHILDKKSSCKISKTNLENIINEKGEILINLDNTEVRNSFFKSNLTTELSGFKDVLSFIDSMLGTTFSKSPDGLLELNLFIRQKGKFTELLQSASRVLKIIEIYYNLEENPNYLKNQIKDFLKDSNIYNKDITSSDNKKSFFLTDSKGVYLSSVYPGNSWILTLIDARMTLDGTILKAVTKDFSGNFRANYTPTFLGARLKSYLETSKKHTASSKLLFVNNQDAITTVGNDSEIKLKDGSTKAVKEFTRSELIHHAIIDKFFLPLVTRDPVFILPTTFSDKTKLIQYAIKLNRLGIGISNRNISEICAVKLYNSVGSFYTSIWENIMSDYKLIFPDVETILDIENKLNNISELDFIKLANEKGITVYEELHYRKNGKGLTINELLYDYANNLYSSLDNLKKRLNQERINFVNDLIRTLTTFSVTREINGKINLTDPIGNFIKEYGNSEKFERDWISGNDLILAKIRNKKTGETKNVLTEEILPDEIIELNPLLEAYFSIDTLISNNLRFSLTGSEINHPVKTGLKVAQVLADNGIEDPNITDKTTTVQALEYIEGKINDPNNSDVKLYKTIKNIIRDKLIYFNESNTLNTLLKRNVPIPGTITPYILNRIYGVPETMRCAVIKDVQASVYNFDGSSCVNNDGTYGSLTIDAHDGYAHISPIMSILENNSLHENEVGTMKKNLLHSYDYEHGVATLFKYAAGAITNRAMRDSELSPIRLLNIFKKMHNERWSNRYADGKVEWNFGEKVDLLKSDYRIIPFDFFNDILLKHRIFYETKGETKLIVDFGRENGDYFTKELKVINNGDPSEDSELITVYHYFDNNGKHIKSLTPITEKFDEQGNEIIHTIDSLYELFLAMGGINSLELQGNKLVESEASIFATTGFVNYVANKVTDEKNPIVNLTNYDLPLKRAMIGYIINKSANKNGAGNINPVTSYYDDTPLKTITVETRGHGILQDSDHTADEAEMTEPTLVITALDAGGRNHNYVRQIYQAIGKIILESCSIELDAISEFREIGNKTKLYDLLGRVVANNIKESNKGLLKAIMKEIRKTFNINSDHFYDKLKIPFSDSNIYSLILSTLTSIINRKAITRKYPGSGMVMMPGYDIETIFDYNGLLYQFIDLLEIAKDSIPEETLQQLAEKSLNDSHFNRLLVQELLKEELAKHDIVDTFDWVNPADRVNIYLNDGINENFVKDINLDSIDDYYSFKHLNLRKFLAEKLYGVKIGKEYDKPWRPKEDNSHLNPDGSVKTNKAFAITLNGVLGFFEIVKDEEAHFWSLHCKTGITLPTGEVIQNPNFTEELKLALFKAAALVIPKGDYLSTYGELTPGGISTLSRFAGLGFTQVDNRLVHDKDGNEIEIPIWQSNLEIKYQKNITKPRNLKPVEIVIKRADGTFMNVFDTYPIKQLYLTGIRNKDLILEMFDDLNEGRYWDGFYDKLGNKMYEQVEVIRNDAAEFIGPNVYLSNFNIPANMSLVLALNNDKIFRQSAVTINSDSFDIAFTKNNNLNVYITFKPINDNSETFKSNLVPWKNILIVRNTNEDSKYVNKIIALDDDNMELIEIGRQFINPNVIYDSEKDVFTDLSGKELDNQKSYTRYENGLVLESVYFILKRVVRKKIKNRTRKYILYNINHNALHDVYDDNSKKSEYDFIGKLMSDIYNTDDFNGVQLNTSMTVNSANLLRKSLNEFALRLSHNKLLYGLILGNGKDQGLRDLLTSARNFTDLKLTAYKIKEFNLNKIIKSYYKKLGAEIKESFKKSLYFTSSRIPAQSHQSFMKMKGVAFTRGNITNTYVSHFQTWLLGSDYRL